MSLSKVEALAEKVKALSPADRLRLAAGLLEAGNYDTAQVLIDGVSGELTLVKFMSKGASAPEPHQ